MSSISFLATSSSMPRACRFMAGGRYTFPTQISSPPYSCIPTLCAYSFPTYFSTFIPYFTSMAIPPLLSVALLSSYTRYPGISSFTGDCCSHVSYMHRTSTVWMSRIIFSLNMLAPAQLKLPTASPSIFQRRFRSILALRRRAEPFVLFFCILLCYPWP